ncbi:MAG TPA: nitroreductase family deazaflavin-dependent oxidoreductase [Acidimicrobiales bacterium]|nr:nitroreductase family deazaflavin-dependent oxidoreductase [Acidimicrobiales bacterium]
MSWANDRIIRTVNHIHRTAFTATDGRLFGNLLGMPVVKLTTIGRKSGKPRTSMLTSPAKDGDNLVLVASYGGSPKHPDWFLNLRDNPEVEVMTPGFKGRRKARIATPEEKARIWPELTRNHKNYAGYQEKTTRDIPLVILEPVG